MIKMKGPPQPSWSCWCSSFLPTAPTALLMPLTAPSSHCPPARGSTQLLGLWGQGPGSTAPAGGCGCYSRAEPSFPHTACCGLRWGGEAGSICCAHSEGAGRTCAPQICVWWSGRAGYPLWGWAPALLPSPGASTARYVRPSAAGQSGATQESCLPL